MGVGIEVYATDSTLLLSTDMICWFCRKSGTGTTVSSSGVGNTVSSKVVIPVSGLGYTYPIVAISINSGYYAARANNASNGDYQYISDAPIGTSYTYYLYDYAPTLPARNIGIESFNQTTGQRTFSSEFWPFKPLTDITPSGSATYPGKTLAIAGPTPGGHRIAGPINYYDGWPFPYPVPDGDPYDSTGYQNDGKLYGGGISGSTATWGDVSYDDVYFGPVYGDIYVPPDWVIDVPVLAVDVSNIPIGSTFF